MHKIAFLHIPKTAGQTVHHAIGAIYGAPAISPYRLPSHVPKGTPTYPGKYAFHSGHLRWPDHDGPPPGAFVFTILRDPRERLASAWFHMRRVMEARAAEQGVEAMTPVQRAYLGPPERFFFGDDPDVAAAVRARLWNLTLTYFAFRTLYRPAAARDMGFDALMARGLASLDRLSAVYDVRRLGPLEDDVERLLGQRPEIAGRRSNAADLPAERSRWAALVDALGSDRLARALEGLVAEDEAFVARLGEISDGEGGRLKGGAL